MRKNLLQFSTYIAILTAFVSGACLDSESIIFPIIFLASMSWLCFAEKKLSEDE